MARKALIVGINYVRTEHALRGCAEDALSVEKLLLRNGFSDITMISDDIQNAHFYPSRDNILMQLRRLITESKPGDILFLHYSGHGTYTRDKNYEETDGKDEAICPASGENIIDDDLKEIIDLLPEGVNFNALMDCCHSGSILDLEENLERQNRSTPDSKQHGYAVMISGCQDNQTSADAYINNKFQGAMTAAFMNWIGKNSLDQYFDIVFSGIKSQMRELRDTINTWLKSKNYPQKPNVAFEGIALPVPVAVPALPPVAPEPVQVPPAHAYPTPPQQQQPPMYYPYGNYSSFSHFMGYQQQQPYGYAPFQFPFFGGNPFFFRSTAGAAPPQASRHAPVPVHHAHPLAGRPMSLPPLQRVLPPPLLFVHTAAHQQRIQQQQQEQQQQRQEQQQQHQTSSVYPPRAMTIPRTGYY